METHLPKRTRWRASTSGSSPRTSPLTKGVLATLLSAHRSTCPAHEDTHDALFKGCDAALSRILHSEDFLPWWKVKFQGWLIEHATFRELINGPPLTTLPLWRPPAGHDRSNFSNETQVENLYRGTPSLSMVTSGIKQEQNYTNKDGTTTKRITYTF